MYRTLFLIVCAFAFGNGLAQPVITIGPYLQCATRNSIVLRWETQEACAGTVVLKPMGSGLPMEVAFLKAQRHEVLLTDLQPGWKYQYDIRVNQQSLIPAGLNATFVTLKNEQQWNEPFRFWVTGDFGKGIPAQDSVYQAFLQYNQNKPLDGWIWLGDNAYPDGTEEQYHKFVFSKYRDLMCHTVAWPAPGNHDYHSVDSKTDTGPYYDLLTMPTKGESGGVPSGTESYYSFTIGNIHFISLNSENRSLCNDTLSPMGEWLKRDLEANTATWLVAYWHKPPYTRGSHDSDSEKENMKEMRSLWLPILERYGTDVVFTGHSHSYERSGLIHGHYGKAATFDENTMLLSAGLGSLRKGNPYYKAMGKQPGTLYVVDGHCGTTLNNPGKLDHPAMIKSENTFHGSVIMEVHYDTLKLEMISDRGEVWDELAIVKKPMSILPRPKMNQIQILASHNSYKLKPDPRLMRFLNKRKLIRKAGLDPNEINYGHASIDSQFSVYKIRGLEIDVYADPKGNLFNKRQINVFVKGLRRKVNDDRLKQPGLKVLHIKDVDYQSSVLTFKDALLEIRKWSQAHPGHLPLLINLEAKQDGPGNQSKILRAFGFKPAPPFDSLQTEAIDREIRSVFNESQGELITPDFLRKGYPSLEKMALNQDWPSLDAVRGKVAFILEGEADAWYLKGHPTLEGRACFVYQEPGSPAAAFVIRNDPETKFAEIQQLVEKGYMVRTRSDSGANEARKKDYTRFKKALASGAHIISTDFYAPDPEIGDFQIQLPGNKAGRSNPINGMPFTVE